MRLFIKDNLESMYPYNSNPSLFTYAILHTLNNQELNK